MKVVKISGDEAVVESAEHRHTVNIALLKNLKIGDYVLAHGDLAINKVEKEDAKEILKLVL